jgi:hypothetical protein
VARIQRYVPCGTDGAGEERNRRDVALTDCPSAHDERLAVAVARSVCHHCWIREGDGFVCVGLGQIGTDEQLQFAIVKGLQDVRPFSCNLKTTEPAIFDVAEVACMSMCEICQKARADIVRDVRHPFGDLANAVKWTGKVSGPW